MKSVLGLSKNLTIIGPPGSGKGFYGRPVASYFHAPLLTASSILRSEAPDLDLGSGQLIECETVSRHLQSFFSHQETSRRYILDGFPRTPKQIELMETHWPSRQQARHCLHLNVPDEVCERKMLGRRHCSKCGAYCNLADVQILGFDLPPQLPSNCAGGEACRPETDWTIRSDDTPEIVRERLRLYRQHEAPILDHYRNRGRLLSFTPYLGELDVPKLQAAVEEWLQSVD